MMKYVKKFYYWGIIIGLVILGVAVYSSTARGGQLKALLKKRPKRKKPGMPKLPPKPSVIDYVDLYHKKLQKL